MLNCDALCHSGLGKCLGLWPHSEVDQLRKGNVATCVLHV